MKYLVIPDIHNRCQDAENLIAAMPEHHPIFLGDYFDQFNDTPEDAEQTAKWLSWSISQGRTHLMGNHDLPYRWRHQNCPGFTQEKYERVKREINPSYWNEVGLFKIIHKEGLRPLILSHAGFTLPNLYGITNVADTHKTGRAGHLRDLETYQHVEMIEYEGGKCLEAASYLGDHHWFNQGTRMGYMMQGGPFWLDIGDIAAPIPGVDQIVGHSWVNTAKRKSWPTKADPKQEMWCIDGGGMIAATVEMEDNGVGGLLVTPIHATGKIIGKPI